MVKKLSPLEKKADLIIKYRDYKITDKETDGNNNYVYLKKEDESYIMQLNNSSVGIAILRNLRDKMKEEKIRHGIVLTNKKYTYYARSHAAELGIELIPRKIPSFDIFKHNLLSNAKKLTKTQKEKLLKKYHSQGYQLPRIQEKDPVSILLGAKQGDIIKFNRKSITAGNASTYRYVV